jgi:SAM-dependent methyltransferase
MSLRLDEVAEEYGRLFCERGETPEALRWRNTQVVNTLYSVLLEVVKEERNPFSVLDFGCGYGALIPKLEHRLSYYRGVDISVPTLNAARAKYPQYDFATEMGDDRFDYCLGCGTFNVKMTTPDAEWREWVLETVRRLGQLCRKGMAVNFLSWKPEWRRDQLWYPDHPGQITRVLADLGRTEVVDDYGIHQFTVFLRRG